MRLPRGKGGQKQIPGKYPGETSTGLEGRNIQRGHEREGERRFEYKDG